MWAILSICSQWENNHILCKSNALIVVCSQNTFLVIKWIKVMLQRPSRACDNCLYKLHLLRSMKMKNIKIWGFEPKSSVLPILGGLRFFDSKWSFCSRKKYILNSFWLQHYVVAMLYA